MTIGGHSTATKKEKEKFMKKTNPLLAAAVVTLGVALSAQAGNVLMSPKAKEQANSQRKAVAMTSDHLNRTIKPVSPRYAEFQRSIKTVQTSGANIDLAHATRPTLSPRDQRYQAALQANAAKEFQVAPLK